MLKNLSICLRWRKKGVENFEIFWAVHVKHLNKRSGSIISIQIQGSRKTAVFHLRVDDKLVNNLVVHVEWRKKLILYGVAIK